MDTNKAMFQNIEINSNEFKNSLFSYLSQPHISNPFSTCGFTNWFRAFRFKLGYSTKTLRFKLSQSHLKSVKKVSDILPQLINDDFHVFSSDAQGAHVFKMNNVGHPSLSIEFEKSWSGHINVCITGDEKEVDSYYAFLKNNYEKESIVPIVKITGFDESGEAKVSHHNLLTKDIVKGNDTFYPWLEGGVENFIDRYAESKSNILVLYGEWGTGKSTFIRTIYERLNSPNNVSVSNENVFLNHHFSTWLEGMQNGTILSIEDADNLVSSREDGNPIMSSILNVADGLTTNSAKIIISTNLSSIKKMDKALIRPGRAYAVLKFRKLTAKEANAARESVGKKAIDFDKHGEFTLSEALNYEEIMNMADSSEIKIGF